MDFFAHQDAARAASRRLVVMLVIGTAGLLVAVNLLTSWGLRLADDYHHIAPPPYTHLVVTLGTLAIVVIGSWLKIRELAGGGPTLAVLLGGREVLPTAHDPAERRLRNVVEEMAIAAGIPVPAVFVLESPGINAFAAGHRLDDTAIAVTRGCLENLNRDELQAVVGHETSHLLNGDARLNLRLIGAVHGLLAICHVGRVVFQAGYTTDDGISGGFSGRRRRDSVPVLLLIGVGLMAIGSLGWLMANIVRACVSRQREFLADAAAVQFTRNGSAMANVLKKALQPGIGSRVDHAQAGIASQLFFADALRSGGGLFASHPPLEERIRRIEPGWNGSAPLATTPLTRQLDQPAPSVSRPAATTRSPVLPGPEQVDYAAGLLRILPTSLTAAAGEAYSARAAVLVTLLTAEPTAQLTRIRATDPTLATLVQRLLPDWQTLESARARLPLLHLALAALRRLSPTQRDSLLALVADTALHSDERGQLAALLVRAHLGERRVPTDFHALTPLLGDIAAVLASIAVASSSPAEAFRAGWVRLMTPGAPPALPPAVASATLGSILTKLARANAAIRRRIVEACGFTVAADGRVTADEAEQLRLVCEMLGQPLPIFRDQR